MNITLTQKERLLLEDQKKHEELCIEKYTSYANQTKDPELKQLFQQYASQEQRHLDSVNQMLGGQVPNLQNQQGQQNQQNQHMQQSTAMSGLQAAQNSSDASLCQDMLTTEKYVSGAYDTTIFEFTNSQARQVLNHIQKEEQEHGEGIFNYMQSHGMYNPQ
ncbi:MAG: spore coat protein [Limnochordia bacterium]|jgi:spore coat protein CotF|nr:spore coat protein [Limnochordia bacterium]